MNKKINKKASKKKKTKTKTKTKTNKNKTKNNKIQIHKQNIFNKTHKTKQKGKKNTQNKIKLIKNQESVNNIPNKQQRRRGYLTEQRVVEDYQMLIIQRKIKYRHQKNQINKKQMPNKQ